MLLQHLTETARRAHYNLSHFPERVGDRIVSEYSVELEQDLQAIEKFAISEEAQAALESTKSYYKQKYEALLTAWLHSLSNCASSFITGGSNFPVRQQEKRRRWADNHYNEFRNWRGRMLKVLERRGKPSVTVDGELEAMKKKLQQAEERQVYMREVNAIYRKYKRFPDSLDTATLNGKPLDETTRKVITTYVPRYSWEPHPFAPYQLTNNLANIKRMQERVKVLESKVQNIEQGNNNEIAFTGGKVLINHEADRIQIFHDEKPAPEVITSLKKSAFKWSPSNKCWQRQLTDNAKYATQKLLNIKF